jgi:hypothetical protein
MSLRSVRVFPRRHDRTRFPPTGFGVTFANLRCERPPPHRFPRFSREEGMTNRRPRSRTLASTLAAVALLSGALYAASGSASAAPAHPAGAARTSSEASRAASAPPAASPITARSRPSARRRRPGRGRAGRDGRTRPGDGSGGRRGGRRRVAVGRGPNRSAAAHGDENYRA